VTTTYLIDEEVLREALLVMEFLSDARLSEQGQSSIKTLRAILASPPAERIEELEKVIRGLSYISPTTNC
jgi:hypothetical protein